MMKRLKFLVPALLLSCVTKNRITDESTKPIKIIKFMGVSTYPTEISKKIFWNSDTEEYMYTYWDKSDIVSNIVSLVETNENFIKEYDYVFITPNDTLYSDSSLQSWVLVRNKKEKYYYDKSGKIALFLKSTYPFFRDCPYNP